MADGRILIDVDIDTSALEQSMAEIGAALSGGTEQFSQWAGEVGQRIGTELAIAVSESIASAGVLGVQAVNAMGQSVGAAGVTAFTAASVTWRGALEAGLVSAFKAFESGAATAGILNALQAQAAVVRSSTLLSAAMTEVINRAKSAAASAASAANFAAIGANIAQGLASGIRSNAGVVTAAAQALVASVQAVTRNMLQIHSPSRWAMEIGEYIDRGLAEGIEDHSALVLDSASRMIADLQEQVELSAEDMLSIELAALDELIAREKAGQKERARAKEIADKERRVSEAETNEDIEKARQELSETLIKYEIEDMEVRRSLLADEIKVYEEMRKEQAEIVKDIKHEEYQMLTEYYDLETERATVLTKEKIKLYDEEYIAKVRGIDEGLAAFLEASNAEIEAIIARIALTDEETAARLSAIQEEKLALTERNAAEKAAREQRQYEEKEAAFKKRILEAETLEEMLEHQADYNAWKEEQDYKSAQKMRENRIKELEAEQKQILQISKQTNSQLLEDAEQVRKASDAAVKERAEEIKNGTVDLGYEKEMQDSSLVQLQEYVDHAVQVRGEGNERLLAEQEEYRKKEYSAVDAMQKGVARMLADYAPEWFERGKEFIDNLVAGIESGFSALDAAVSYILGRLDSVGGVSGGLEEIPVYGKGGVVSAPHLAVVGDVPEAIIPLNQLPKLLSSALMASGGRKATGTAGGAQGVNVNQNIVIQQPVESPAEVARAIKNVSRGLCYG